MSETAAMLYMCVCVLCVVHMYMSIHVYINCAYNKIIISMLMGDAEGTIKKK